MPTLEEAANAFARDIMTMNFAGLMTVFTPEGMMKAMAIQGQMLAQMQASGQAVPQPIPGQMGPMPGQMPGQVPAQALPTDCEVVVGEAEGEDYPVGLTFSGLSGTGVFKTSWREIEGVWKVNDMAIVSLTPRE